MTKYKVPHTFIPGTKANATHINENFTSVVDAIEEAKASGANLDLSNLSAAGKKAIFDNSSRSKLIGEIITSAIPLTDSGLHLLDGSKLLGGGIYDKFIQYIAGLVSANPSLFITEEKWQESVTNYGVCSKFVYDAENNSVRLPKIDETIYGNSDTVQDKSVKVLFYIVVSTTAKLDIEMSIDNIATDLNGKVDKDLSNCTRPYVTETYQNGSSWYRLYSDGWLEQGGSISVNTGTATVHLIKNYKNTSYTIVKADNGGHTTNATGVKRVDYRAVNSFQLLNSDINNGSTSIYRVDWQTSGYSEI